MTVLEEIEKIREAEGDSLDYSISVCSETEQTIPGWRIINGRKGHLVTKLKITAKYPKWEYYAEAIKTCVKSSETERVLLDGSKEKAVFRAYYIYVDKIDQRNKGTVEGGKVTFREDKGYEDFVKERRKRKSDRVPTSDGLLDD